MRILLIAAIVAGIITAFYVCAKWWTERHPLRLSKDDVIKVLGNFLDDKGGPYDWDDFLSVRIAEPELEALRQRCNDIDWKTESGAEALRKELEKLKASAK